MSALEERILAVQRERKSTTSGIGIAMLWLLSDDQSHIVRSMARDMNLHETDFREADQVERIASNGWELDDLINALDA